MTEVKKCIRSLAVCYLLLAVTILPETGMIPIRFPTYRFSSVYLLLLSVCLILRYYLIVAGRKNVKHTMMHIAVMIFLLFFFRGLKYTVFGNVSALGRYCWYLYYVPMLCIPMLLFYVALFIYAGDAKRVIRTWVWVFVVTVILVLMVLTNDLHQQIFRFQPGLADWDGNYSYGIGFILITAWQYLLYTAAVGILVLRYSIAGIKRWSWMILVPFAIGISLMILLVTGNLPQINGHNILELPEILCCMVAAVLECCMQLGLIPINESYSKVFQISSLPVQITDEHGTPLYQSASAMHLSPEQIHLSDGVRMEEHTILHKLSLSGGYGFWQEDVTVLDRLKEELEEVREQLSEETELIRLQNELKVKQESIEQRTLLYDEIAIRTQPQSLAISDLSRRAANTTDTELRDKLRKQIAILGSYIKRYANLMILSAENDTISVGELGLSFAEVLRYLNLYGIPGEMMNVASGSIPAENALAVFEVFETLIEHALPTANGVIVNIAQESRGALCKFTIENILPDCWDGITSVLTKSYITPVFEYEDSVGYFTFPLSKGGDEA